jgi:thymidylate kinase
MKGLIVIDGCDGTGKTTLAEAICERFDGHYLHNTYRWPNKMPLYHTASLHYALKLAREKLVVIDRLWMSEAIYADVYRGGSPWPHMGRMIDRMIRRFCGVYILTQSPENHKQKFDELKAQREEMYDNVEEVRKRYDMLFEGGFGGHDRDYVQQLSVFGMRMRDDVLPYRYDIEGRDLDTYIDMVSSVAAQRKKSQLPYIMSLKHENFAGHVGDAEYIFVGDSTNSKMRAINWPWYDFGNSSELFASTLHNLLFDETLAVYTNANSPNGPMYVQDCLLMKPELKVIALGGSAAETLDHCNIKFQQVMHPSYAKRFNKEIEFTNQLREVVCHEHS